MNLLCPTVMHRFSQDLAPTFEDFRSEYSCGARWLKLQIGAGNMKVRAAATGLVLVWLAIYAISRVEAQFQPRENSTGLKVGFYNFSCPAAEDIVRDATFKKFAVDKTITPGLLRLHFHDCFVTGCDASVLIKSTKNNTSEMDSIPNLTLHGLDLIDTVKTALEKACPRVVSCADIITLATRDAVVMAGGLYYDVPTGRRDGLVSQEIDVLLPSPSLAMKPLFSTFKMKGFSLEEMVTLLGAHTVGVGHCAFFSDRLWNFLGTGKPDPSMDPKLVVKLRKICPPVNPSGFGNTTALDRGTIATFDNSYYKQILRHRGIFSIDQNLADDNLTSSLVKSYALAPGSPPKDFRAAFGPAIVKMGTLSVLTGCEGEIRKVCSRIN